MQYQKREERLRKEAIFRLYRTYGEEIFGAMRSGDYYSLQSRFVPEARREIALEDIALFVSTLHLEKSSSTRLKEVREKEGNISVVGEVMLEGNISYPVEIIVVRRRGKILLRRLRIGKKILQMNRHPFPLETGAEGKENTMTDMNFSGSGVGRNTSGNRTGSRE
jgi:hypothetical protein